jgi:hypothetical protein
MVILSHREILCWNTPYPPARSTPFLATGNEEKAFTILGDGEICCVTCVSCVQMNFKGEGMGWDGGEALLCNLCDEMG